MSKLLCDILNKDSSLITEEDKEFAAVSLFTCKDVNKIPWKTFGTIRNILVEIMDIEREQAEVLSILISQSLSVSNQLIVNVNDPEVKPQDILDSVKNSDITFEYIQENLIKDYKLHCTATLKKEKFIKSVTALTNNQELLASTASFVHYHCIHNISEDDVIHRDCALANLIRLSNLNGIYKELKVLLEEQFDINESAIKAFIISHIDLILGVN